MLPLLPPPPVPAQPAMATNATPAKLILNTELMFLILLFYDEKLGRRTTRQILYDCLPVRPLTRLPSITEYHNCDGIANRGVNDITDLMEKTQGFVAKKKRHTLCCGVLVE
jgi:hypothetical protein